MCLNFTLADPKTGHAKPFKSNTLVTPSQLISSVIREDLLSDPDKSRLWSVKRKNGTNIPGGPEGKGEERRVNGVNPIMGSTAAAARIGNAEQQKNLQQQQQQQEIEVVLGLGATFSEAGVEDGQQLILEVLGDDGVWPTSRLPSKKDNMSDGNLVGMVEDGQAAESPDREAARSTAR